MDIPKDFKFSASTAMLPRVSGVAVLTKTHNGMRR
jgi:hypothetical protein